MKTFRDFLQEMAGTGAVYDSTCPKRSKDFQWSGDPKSANPHQEKKLKKKRSKS